MRSTWPTTAQLQAAGQVASTGKYVTSVASTAGAITIQYGNQANATALASGQNSPSLTAYVNTNNDIIWVCGNAAIPTGASIGTATVGTSNVKVQYLPSTCHS
jgi:hypothetical protein